MEECNHHVGMDYVFDDLILISESEKSCLEYNDLITTFNYCPKCGEKLNDTE